MKIKILRREFLKALSVVPLAGYFSLFFKGKVTADLKKMEKKYVKDLGLENIEIPGSILLPSANGSNNLIRVGLIGHGWRGSDLLRALGFAHPSWIKENTINREYNQQLKLFLQQEDLNVEFTGICDIFSIRAEQGVETSLNEVRPLTNKRAIKAATIYLTYCEMINSKDIDAIIIATPDHWHAKMAIEAARAGKHVYCEKPMTRTIEEAIELKNTLKGTGVVFQLGHQNRQQMSYKMAKEILNKNILGMITLIETYTNRNSDHGAWIRGIDQRGNPDTINLKEFLGNATWHEFDPDRYFNWQKWFEYGSSVTGNQFTHAYDCVNQIVGIGIPQSVVATGGLYHYKDARNIPDVFNAVYNYPDKGLTLTYDCTLKNSVYRNTFLMGTDAAMEIGSGVTIYKDSESSRYSEIKIDPKLPLYSYHPDPKIDALSSATSNLYHLSGYGNTIIDGIVYDSSYLHMKEWIDAIRGHNHPSCDIDRGFEESITYIMSNIAYLKKKVVSWDPINEKVMLS